MFVSADVTDLMYNVSLGGADLPLLIIPTNDTQYCLKLTPCWKYIITVTPFSTNPGYVGVSNNTEAATDGGTMINFQKLELMIWYNSF